MEFVFKISLASYSFSLKQKNSSVKFFIIKLLVISITLFVISLITGKTKTNNGI